MNDIHNSIWQEPVWSQFGAAIDMLENAINACPAEHWAVGPENQQFWYLAFHTIFFLDYYQTEYPETFAAVAPFGLTELDPEGLLPERVFSKTELLDYLAHGREKCRQRILKMTEREATEDCPFPNRKLSNLEFLLYQLRHVQHHSAQLNLLLRQSVDDAPKWVSRSRVVLLST